MVVGPLDQLGDEDDILTITPKAHTAQGRNEVVKLTRHDTYDAKDEEEDTFDPYAIAPPRFTELPAVRESRAYAVQGTESSDTPLEPADPWERLQSQYRIRPESGSPSTSKRSKATVASGALGPDDELILDEDARFTVAAPARGRAQDRRAPARAAVESAGPKVSKWGDGAMAQAGELMLGRGALDNDDGIVDQNSFSGGLYGDNSKFSADYVEYQGNDASLDMDALEVPKFNDNVVDMAMEDFNEDLETFGVKKDSKPSLEDKLRMFEEADHGDMDEDDLFLKEELRLLASSADALNL